MTKQEQIYRDIMLQSSNILATQAWLMIRRHDLAIKKPDRKDLIDALDTMIENLTEAYRAEEYKTLRLKVMSIQILNRDKKIRGLEHELKKARKINEHLIDEL